MRKYVLSGGPGVGKTTILNKLREDGHPGIGEVPRTIIRYEQRYAEQLGREPILPTTDVETFQYHVALRQLYKEEQRAEKNSYAFLDRSLIDPLGYSKAFGFSVSNTFKRLVEQANYNTVFFLEQLNNYENDRERYEDKELANHIHEALKQTYQEQDIRFVSVPDIGVEGRVTFIYEHLCQEPAIQRYQRTRPHYPGTRSMYQLPAQYL